MTANSVLKITLDTQCINDLLERRADASWLDACLRLAREGLVEIGIPAICGSENLPGYVRPETLSLFLERLEKTGLSRSNLLFPIAYPDVTFWDCSIWSDDNLIALERKIHDILFPEDPAEYDASGKAGSTPEKMYGKWINRKCDVLVAWSHIHYGRDVLLTRDRNFLKRSKLPHLLALGAGRIVTPKDFVSSLS